MAKQPYMLDTNICSFLIRKKPEYLLEKVHQTVLSGHEVIISAITYAELMFGAASKKASPKMAAIVDEFVERLDDIAAWDKTAVVYSSLVKSELESRGKPIGHNDILIAGHAIGLKAILVTDNVREFARVKNLTCENWIDR